MCSSSPSTPIRPSPNPPRTKTSDNDDDDDDTQNRLTLDFSPPAPILSSTLRCCCGHPDCSLLRENCSVLDNVERDMLTASALGQALLVRHEAYMADAAGGASSPHASRIADLERAKADLEAANCRTIDENRYLLNQLELMNSSVSDSEAHIRALEASLLASQLAVRRLEAAAARAADMERHIAALELEQAVLQTELVSSEAEARSTMQRWRLAEQSLNELQSQLERIDAENQLERERHHDALAQLEQQQQQQQREREREPRVPPTAKPEPPAVSLFVRDLLRDNAALQTGIAELRELLVSSNDEIQALREQLLLHQPVDAPSGDLSDELARAQQLHIHHHYHKPPPKQRKKRASAYATPAPLTPASLLLRSSRSRAAAAAPVITTPVRRESVDTTASSSHRWSLFSEPSAASTVPSSPEMSPLALRMRAACEPARSPVCAPLANVPELAPLEPLTPLATPRRAPLQRSSSHESIISLGGLDIHTLRARPSQLALGPLGTDAVVTGVVARPTMARGAVAGACVLRENLLATPAANTRFLSPRALVPAVLGGRSVSEGEREGVARPAAAGGGLARLVAWRPWSSAGADPAEVPTAAAAAAPAPTTAALLAPPSPVPAIACPASASPAALAPASSPGAASLSSALSTTPRGSPRGAPQDGRSPGINQPGAIPGFHEYLAHHQRRGAPSRVLPAVVDREALRDGLAS